MDKLLKTRLAELNSLIDKTTEEINFRLSNLNYLKGARQECEHLIELINQAPKSLDEVKNMLGADSVEVMQ